MERIYVWDKTDTHLERIIYIDGEKRAEYVCDGSYTYDTNPPTEHPIWSKISGDFDVTGDHINTDVKNAFAERKKQGISYGEGYDFSPFFPDGWDKDK
jgi:hypothetical protein